MIQRGVRLADLTTYAQRHSLVRAVVVVVASFVFVVWQKFWARVANKAKQYYSSFLNNGQPSWIFFSDLLLRFGAFLDQWKRRCTYL